MSPKDYAPWVPFDFYDFFGYIFPGIFFCLVLFTFFAHSFPTFLEWHQNFWFLFEKAEFLISTLTIVSFIVIVYVIGHFIATASHVVIDRVLIAGIVGYPVIHLLGLNFTKRDYSESTAKYLFVLFNLLLLLPLFYQDHVLLSTSMNYVLIVIGLLSSFRVLIAIIKQHPKGDILAKRFGDKKFFRIYLILAQRILDPIIKLFQRLISIDRGFPPEFVAKYKELFKESFGISADKVETENYWLSFFKASAMSPYHASMIRTWLHLYGFSRNISAAAYLCAVVIVCINYFYPTTLSYSAKIHLLIIISIAWVLGIRYWILYSTYYTKSVIRSFVAISSITKEEAKLFKQEKGITNI